MNYQTILSKLRAAADELFAEMDSPGLFHYGIKETHQNENTDEAMPQIHIDPFTDVLNTDKATSTVRVFIGFLDKDSADSNAEQQSEIQFRMESLSRDFFGILSDDDDFSEIVVNRNFIHHHTHIQLTGIVCDFTITTGVKLC